MSSHDPRDVSLTTNCGNLNRHSPRSGKRAHAAGNVFIIRKATITRRYSLQRVRKFRTRLQEHRNKSVRRTSKFSVYHRINTMSIELAQSFQHNRIKHIQKFSALLDRATKIISNKIVLKNVFLFFSNVFSRGCTNFIFKPAQLFIKMTGATKSGMR